LEVLVVADVLPAVVVVLAADFVADAAVAVVDVAGFAGADVVG
jgi:hypothetical protein